MTGPDPVRVGIVGRGFGEKVVAKAFAATAGCEVVGVVSPRDETAVATLCARDDVDLISVHSPPFLHEGHVRLAIEAGHAVLCDKPFGRDAAEAAAMCDLARSAGVQNFLNFEFRYDPGRERLRELVRSGAVGEPEYLSSTMYTATSRVPMRPYGWLFDRDLGGGWIGALGSHMIDFARWTFGEIEEVSATLRTAIAERPDPEGRMHRCTAEDGFTASLRSVTGVSMVIDSTSAAPVHLSPTLLVIGSEGVLELTPDHRIVTRRRDGTREEHPVEMGGANPMGLAMGRFAAEICEALQRGSAPPGAPTFSDGLACAALMDRMRGRRRGP